MRDITLKNFRCYEEKTMTFRRGINLLIGDNSVGKTSLLRACNLVINSFFCGYSDENTKWKSAEPKKWQERQSTPEAVYESIPELVESLLQEQGHYISINKEVSFKE